MFLEWKDKRVIGSNITAFLQDCTQPREIIISGSHWNSYFVSIQYNKRITLWPFRSLKLLKFSLPSVEPKRLSHVI
jgi:hypothetical protein